jgi:hypothetical protein
MKLLVMPDHLHLILTTTGITLERAVQSFSYNAERWPQGCQNHIFYVYKMILHVKIIQEIAKFGFLV